MDEATANAIAEATTRLDEATHLREESLTGSVLVEQVEPALRRHAMLVAEAHAWATLAHAAAIAAPPEMPSFGEVLGAVAGRFGGAPVPTGFGLEALGDLAGEAEGN